MKHKTDSIFQYFIGNLYSFVFINLMAAIVYPSIYYLNIIIISVISYALISLVLMNKLSSWIFIVFTAFASGIIVFLCWVQTPISDPVVKIAEGMFVLWYKIIYGESIQNPLLIQCAYIFVILSSVIISVFVVFLYKKLKSFFILTSAIIAMTLFTWHMTGREGRLIFALSCLLTVLNYIRHVYYKKKKAGLVSEKLQLGNFMVFSAPLIIILILTIYLIPKNDLPIQFPWLDNQIMQVINYFEQRFSYNNAEFFSLSSTGFNGSTQRLGGPVRLNNTIVMEVKSNKRIYLRGAVYSWYDKNTWVPSSDKKTEELPDIKRNDIYETRNGWDYIPVEEMFPHLDGNVRKLLGELSNKLDSTLFPMQEVQVKYRNMSTRSVFLPLKSSVPIMVDNAEIMDVTSNFDEAMLSNTRLKPGSTYKAEHIQPMYGDDVLKLVLPFSRKGLYKEAFRIITTTAERPGNTFLWTLSRSEQIKFLMELYERASYIEDEYTKLNENIPQRVRQLAFEVTKECFNDYEKVKTIEKYLRENYTYSLNPKQVPQDKDFVDHFLFEEKTGYCTYFATAMCVMLKSIGIPARYVEGYVLPDNHSDDNIYIVTNRNAHAWVEAYFEGFGWLAFEPTSAYADIMNYRSASKDIDYSGLDYSRRFDQYDGRYDRHDEVNDYTQININPNEVFKIRNYWKYIPFIFAVLLILIILINILASLVNEIIIRFMKDDKKIIATYLRMLKWLESVGYAVKPGETISEFGKRIDVMFIFNECSFSEATKVFSKVRYGKKDVSREELEMLCCLSRVLKAAVLKEMGVKRYVPLRKIIYGI